jgi:hypothetical protein
MRWRVAALVALSGTVAVPAVSDALAPLPATPIKVSVKPRTGSARTRFAVSFRAELSTERSFHTLYRVTASGPAGDTCQSSAGVAASATRAGRTVHVVLAPSGSRRWCVGTYHGRLWDVITVPCPLGKVCPAIVPRPQMVGKFTFRVTRG